MTTPRAGLRSPARQTGGGAARGYLLTVDGRVRGVVSLTPETRLDLEMRLQASRLSSYVLQPVRFAVVGRGHLAARGARSLPLPIHDAKAVARFIADVWRRTEREIEGPRRRRKGRAR